MDEWRLDGMDFTYSALYSLSHPPSLLPSGFFILSFCILAVQGGAMPWSVAGLSLLAAACLCLTLIIWRQPESKTKLSFKVCLLKRQFSLPL